MDIKELKKYIYDNNLIIDLLKNIGMHSIKRNTNDISCAFPDGDNPRGCIVYLSEYLSVRSFTREITKINNKFENLDIIDLVKYICKFNSIKQTTEFICGIFAINKVSYKKNIIKDGTEIFTDNNIQNEDNVAIYGVEILDNYYKRPHIDLFRKDLIFPETAYKFSLRYDLESERIIFPHFNLENNNEILALIGRTTNIFFEEFDIPKYFVLKGTGYKKSKNLYGLAQNIESIRKNKKVIIFEGEKSVLKAYQYGYDYCVSVGCHSISRHQIEILLRLNIEEVTIAFDKGVEIHKILRLVDKMESFFKVTFILDKYDLLMEKDSPVDKGKCIFDILYKYRKSK